MWDSPLIYKMRLEKYSTQHTYGLDGMYLGSMVEFPSLMGFRWYMALDRFNLGLQSEGRAFPSLRKQGWAPVYMENKVG